MVSLENLLKTIYIMKKMLLLMACLAICALSFAQQPGAPTTIGQGTYLGKSEPLRNYPLITEAVPGKSNYRIIPNNFPTDGYVNPNSLPQGGDPIRQSEVNIAEQQRNLELSFDGPNVAESGGALPPDPSGAVGPNHYVSAVNVAIKIYDKEGNVLAGPTSLGNFIGDGQNSGDPIVMYDQLADRWFISQFNISSNGLAIAISETPDPTGAYFLYEYSLNSFPDYPHYSVWHDAYYLTANKGGDNIFALEREAMLAGEANPQIQGFTLPGVINNPNTVFSPEPAYLLGTDFDPEAPGYITYLQDDGWGAAFDHLKVWELDIDFEDATNSTISNPLEIPVTPFDSFISTFGTGELQQPGTGNRIDMITGVISYAAHYRRFEDHNSWLITFNVDVQEDNTTAGIRWIELRNSDTEDWFVFQEGTYAPDDGNSRFMGSGAIDAQGNIGLGFNIGGPELPVGVGYTGRFADDPLGIMTVAEETIVDGVGVQTTTNRFGDYSQLSMDPDNFTFWHMAEYFTSNNSWATRIGAFRLTGGFAQDIGVTTITTPNDGALTATESVEVLVRNFGTEDQTDVEVELRLDGVLLSTETVIGTLPAGESVLYTFTQTVDLSTEGQVYVLEANTTLSGDEFASNNSTSKSVEHLFANDIGVTEILAPVTGESLTDAEIVTVTLENFGSSEQSNFDVTFNLDGTTVTENIAGPLASQASLEYTFVQTVDLSAFQSYNLSVSTSLPNDSDASNDEISATIDNSFCVPDGNCTFGDGFQLFQLGDIDNPSGCEGYADFTALSTDLIQGETYELTITTGFGNQFVNVWIDFNDNFLFEANELIVNNFEIADGQGGGSFTETIDFVLPNDAVLGSHIMRAKTNWNAPNSADACASVTFGETEDYTANIQEFLSVEDQQIAASDLVVASLPNNNFDIQLNTEFNGQIFMAVFNTLGQQLTYKPVAQSANGHRINLDMSAMATGVYVVRLGSRDPKTFKTAKIIVQ